MNVSLQELFYRREIKESLNEFLEGIKQRDELTPLDIRFLCEKGIPAIDIVVRNISIKDFEKGLNKWLNGFYTK